MPAPHKAHSEDSHGWRVSGGIELAVVADGVGGIEGGAEASRKVVETVMDETGWKGLLLSRPADRMKELLNSAHESVEPLSGASTVVAVRRRKNHATLAWVGDSRAYLIREGGVEQLTTDDSWANWHDEQVATGKVKPASKKERQEKEHAITQAIGQNLKEVHTGHVRLRKGDTILLCSDGFYEAVAAEEVQSIANNGATSRVGVLSDIERRLRDSTPSDDATALIWWVE